MSHSRYDKQAILNFGFDNAHWLQKKWAKQNRGKKCDLIDIQPEDKLDKTDQFSPLTELTSRSRLYLYLHGDRGGKFFGGEKGRDYSYKEIANFLASNLNHPSLKNFNDNTALKISLVSCETGSGKKADDYLSSTAANLHRALKEHGINSEIVARTHQIKLKKGKKETYTKETISRDFYKTELDYTFHHKQPGSKVIFSWNSSGEQVVEDAYQASWKEKVLETIEACAKNTTVASKKDFLRQLHSEMQNQTATSILAALQYIVNDKTSFVNEHSGLSFGRTDTKIAFDALVKEGTGLVDSPFATKTLVSGTETKKEEPAAVTIAKQSTPDSAAALSKTPTAEQSPKSRSSIIVDPAANDAYHTIGSALDKTTKTTKDEVPQIVRRSPR